MKLSSREFVLLAAALAGLLLALLGPAVAQHAAYHAFADSHTRWGLPNAWDVLSNLPFAAVGLFGLYRLRTARSTLDRPQRLLALLALTGLWLTAAASSWYHLSPDDGRLVVDRLGMSVAFAGVLGLAGCRVSARAGLAVAVFVLVAAPAAVLGWRATGNLLPWTVLQAGGTLLLLAMALLPAGPGILHVRWGLVVGAYALAKALEVGDHAVWQFTGGLVSGHTLKHLVAAAAAWPLVAALRAAGAGAQDRPGLPARAA